MLLASQKNTINRKRSPAHSSSPAAVDLQTLCQVHEPLLGTGRLWGGTFGAVFSDGSTVDETLGKMLI